MSAQQEPIQRSTPPDVPRQRWELLLRWRWWLAGVIAVAFALGRAVEALLLEQPPLGVGTLVDVLFWAALGGLAVWFSLTWASRQERRHQSQVERSLSLQQELNEQLQRANEQLALLSDVNQQIAASGSLDEILDAALDFPQRLVPADLGALWLYDAEGEVLTRVAGGSEEEVERGRAAYSLQDGPRALRLVSAPHADATGGPILQLPLLDGSVSMGWMDLFLAEPVELLDDERALLTTIANEIGEAISSTRRRSREERALFELEHAIAEERARIARDIHDGLAQTLAFRRMRIDLWMDWIDEEPERLREELIGHKGLLREQIAELRRAIFALRPVQFDELGFSGGLHRYITEFGSQQEWQMKVDLSALPHRLPHRLEAICFRIVQEALTNAAKHADARLVAVRTARVDGGIQLTIRDDGRGFEADSLGERWERLGLRQMRERLAAHQGNLHIVSVPGEGTEVRAWLPVPDTVDERDTHRAGRLTE